MIKTALVFALAIFIASGIFGEHPTLTLIRALVGLTVFAFFALLAINMHNRNVLRRRDRRAWRAVNQAGFMPRRKS